MRKFSLTVLSVVLFHVLVGLNAQSQLSRVAEREVEWNQYVIPQSTFVRQTDPSKSILFQVPSEWKQEQPDKLIFTGPHAASLSVFVEKIPDGVPLRDYVSALMQPLRNLPEGADSLVIRRTTMSNLEAREIMFESNADSEEVTRRIIWCTVSGPNAVSLVLIAPIGDASEIEPYFKAVVQSLNFVDKFDYAGFDALRSSVIKDQKAIRLDEVQSLAASLTTLDSSNRKANITRLASIFASTPDTAIDLMMDGRPMVRAAAAQAIEQSSNSSLEKFLLRALDDRELFVAEQAVRAVAAKPDVLDLLRDQSFDWFKIEPVARVWPFLNKSNQIKILEEIFAQPLIPKSSNPPQKVASQTTRTRVTVQATVLPPGSPPPPVVVGSAAPTSDPNRQLSALTLMKDLAPSDFKLPLNQILAAKNDSLTALALEIAWDRDERLPARVLLNLLTSSSDQVRRMAALHLGESGGMADIKTIEQFSTKPVTIERPTANDAAADPNKSNDRFPSLSDDLRLAITKIRLRDDLANASGAERQQLISKSLRDRTLGDWVWYRYVRVSADLKQAPIEAPPRPARSLKVLPLGENLFPRDVTHYAALPQPASALDKFGNAIDGLQLESARSQANLVLVLSALREQLALELDSPSGEAPVAYSGIDTKKPIAVASWFAEGASGIRGAERNAIIVRVADQERFERSVMLFQQSIGDLRGFIDHFSGAVHLFTVLPAFLPLSAKAILDGSIKPPKQTPLLKYSLVGQKEWAGHPIKVIEERSIDSAGHITTNATYLIYLEDTAVLTPDLESLRDVLTRASSEQPTVATNPDFQRIANATGEAIYFTNLTQLVAEPGTSENSQKDGLTESGTLRIQNSNWENQYQLHFPVSDWLKPFIGFQPDELTAPRDLLPRTTLAYYFMKFDAVAAWHDWSLQLLGAERRKELSSVWAIDFEKEVLPELGPECGIGILGLPNMLANDWELPWVAFFKLKSDKLARVIEGGKLLTKGSATPGGIQIKLDSGELFVTVKNGFLVLSNNRLGITSLDQKERLISSRDFFRAAKQTPAGVIAFGGYNLEAATSAISDPGTDSVKTQQSSLISSLANAFHTPNFYATTTSDTVQGRFSLSMDREGRFSVSELSSLSKDYGLSYAHLEARGLPVQNQERLRSLKLRIRAKAAGEIDRIKEDVSSPYQTAEKTSDTELELQILPRHTDPKTTLALPVKDQAFASYLQANNEIRSDDSSVIEKARSIAGDEHDAWRVARKLAEWTYKNIKWKRVDYATAPQTLATLEADCLEFSQLYVAMARSLGLPARIVSGLAYSGAAFGGHAWVEVFVGEWIEVDPTWGTDFVDATHIRNSGSGALLAYASLNLVELEVLEAPRGIAEFQRDPRALAEKLCQELSNGSSTALTSALDLAVLTNENLGPGTWESLSDPERDVMSSAYRRLLLDVSTGFSRADAASPLRLLHTSESGDRAEAIILDPGLTQLLVKLEFIRRNGAWFLAEILQTDTDLHIVSETIQPTIKSILNRRNKISARGQGTSEFVRALIVMQKDPKAAIAIADRALKDNPGNRALRHVKALALARDQNEKAAIALWNELAGEKEPFAPALLSLACQYQYSEDAEKRKQAIELFNRYGVLEPDDPRTAASLARLYEDNNDDLNAEAAYRAALKLDPSNTGEYVDFATFLALRKRFREALIVIDEADKKADATDDLFGRLMTELYYSDDKSIPEELARSQPQRMARSATANLFLGYVRLENGKSLQSMPLLRKAAALKKEWSEPYDAMAKAYRNLRNWIAALNAADSAIRIDGEDSDGHFQRACALARLGRINEALKSLEKAVELDADVLESIDEETDLKSLASKPEFKKLLADHQEPKQ